MMRKRFFVALASVLINITACLTATALVLYLQDWFGKGDIYAYRLCRYQEARHNKQRDSKL